MLPIFSFIPTFDLTTPLYTPRGQPFDWGIGEKASSVSLEWMADGGCWAASITFPVHPTNAASWIENGLGLHIEVWNDIGEVIWDGYVDTMDFTFGNLSAKFGPMSDVVNQIGVIYAPLLDDTLDPPLYGNETETTLATDSDSQARYGVFERWFQAEPGQTYQAQAEADRDRYLVELAFPKPTQDIDFLVSNTTSLTLGLLGYYHRLKGTIYVSATTATTTASVKLAAILDADPNGMFASANGFIETNSFLVRANESDNRTSEAIISEIVSIGAAATDDRFTFQILPKQFTRYRQIPAITAPKYQRSIYKLSASVEQYGVGVEVAPWDTEPGEWLYQPDISLGKLPSITVADKTRDLRYLFIESVSFSTPVSVQASGEPQGTLAQMIAKANLEL